MPFNKNHLDKWKNAIENRLDLEYGTKSIRSKRMIKILDEPLLIEALEEGLSGMVTDDEETENPCILSDYYIKKYCKQTFSKTNQRPGTLYSLIKGKIIEEVKRLAP